jgi:hypothetical protein
VFNFPVAGIIRVSDVELTVGPNTYEALVSDWGTLEEAADPETANAEVRQQTITIINSGTEPFSDLFLIDSPENVEVELYQWFDGLDEGDVALIDVLVVQDPIEFDENTQTLKLDLVSMNMRYDNFVGPMVTRSDYPLAPDDSIGKRFDYVVGSPGEIKTLKTQTALTATLDGPIVETTTTITVRENVTAWPTAGTFFIDEEEISYSGHGSYSFTAQNRGANGTIAADHADGEEVYQKADHVFSIGWNPTSSVTDVKVSGVAPPAGTYSVPPAIPSTIKFNTRPYSIQYSKTSVTESVEFNGTASGNSAIQAFLAYDGKDSTSAAINSSNDTLAIKRVSAPDDTGHISKIFLVIKHWASAKYLNDQAKVLLNNNLLGILDRPLDGDSITVAGDVNIDHPHTHKTGDSHTHVHSDGDYGADVNDHQHALIGSAIEITAPSYTALPIHQTSPGDNRYVDIYLVHTWTPPGSSSIASSYIHFVAFQAGVEIELFEGSRSAGRWNSDQFSSINTEIATGTSIGQIRVRVHGTHVIGGYARINLATLYITYSTDMLPAKSAVNPYLSTNGTNENAYNTNSDDDVNNFAGNNRTLELTAQSPTRFIETKFDITQTSPGSAIFNWDWFTDQTLKIFYQGSADSVDLLIAEARFDVAVRKRERVYSDDVTCSPTAITSSRPHAVIQELLTSRAGLPAGNIDTDSLQDAEGKYAQFGYFLNGIINGAGGVRDELKNVLKQCRSRLIWTAGKAKLVFSDSFADWEINKSLLANDFQLKSISARRQRVSDLVNNLNINYGKDWTAGKYQSMVSRQNAESIDRLGELANTEPWLFDLVTTNPMVEDLAEYYLSLLSTPSTFYTFNSYLNQFEIEKGDKVKLTSSGFNQMAKMPVAVMAANRVFGSYEGGQFNLINFVAESLRFLKRSIDIQDEATVTDALSMLIGLALDFQEVSSVIDALSFAEEVVNAEQVGASDTLDLVADYNIENDISVTASESISFQDGFVLQDEVGATDILSVSRLIGFGSGGFGIESGFGGIINSTISKTDIVGPADALGFDDETSLDDTAAPGDEISISDGFGSPKLGDGFGLIPFGG